MTRLSGYRLLTESLDDGEKVEPDLNPNMHKLHLVCCPRLTLHADRRLGEACMASVIGSLEMSAIGGRNAAFNRAAWTNPGALGRCERA